MGQPLLKDKFYTPEEYLEFERNAEERHEYLDGRIYPVNKPGYGNVVGMAGESLAHSRICINIAREISFALKGTGCEALSPNMKVRAETMGMFAYPDLSIVCGEPKFHDKQRDVLTNPKVIIEVLSPSTERYDQTNKFFRYRKEISTLTDYVLIYQNMPFVEHHEKNAEGRWEHNAFDGLEDTFRIPSVNFEIPMTEIYDRVDFATVDSFPKS
ncbi:MAG: Uma2 family endonuclease [Pyrinomonadaceae bacterium]